MIIMIIQKIHEYINCDIESCNGNYICPDDDTSKCYKNDKDDGGSKDKDDGGSKDKDDGNNGSSSRCPNGQHKSPSGDCEKFVPIKVYLDVQTGPIGLPMELDVKK